MGRSISLAWTQMVVWDGIQATLPGQNMVLGIVMLSALDTSNLLTAGYGYTSWKLHLLIIPYRETSKAGHPIFHHITLTIMPTRDMGIRVLVVLNWMSGMQTRWLLLSQSSPAMFQLK